MEPKGSVELNVFMLESDDMKVALRFSALILAGVMLFMGSEALLPHFSKLMSKSTAIVFIFVGVYFAFYGVTGRSGFLGKSR